jgi:hypothetical protein
MKVVSIPFKRTSRIFGTHSLSILSELHAGMISWFHHWWLVYIIQILVCNILNHSHHPHLIQIHLCYSQLKSYVIAYLVQTFYNSTSIPHITSDSTKDKTLHTYRQTDIYLLRT